MTASDGPSIPVVVSSRCRRTATTGGGCSTPPLLQPLDAPRHGPPRHAYSPFDEPLSPVPDITDRECVNGMKGTSPRIGIIVVIVIFVVLPLEE